MLKTKKLFTISFALVVFVRAFTWHQIAEFVPYSELYIAFIAFWGLMMLGKGYRKIVSLRSNGLKVIIMLTIYFIVWGLTTIPEALNDALVVMYRSLLMMAFVSVSSFWIRQLNCLDEIIHVTFITLSVLMWGSLLSYIGEINLLKTLASFWIKEEWLRTRTRFGFANNIAAEYSMSVIMLSLYISKLKRLKQQKMLLLLNDFGMLIIILASNSRGTTLSLIFMIFVCFFMSHIKKNHLKIIVKTGVALVITILAIIIYEIVLGRLDITELLIASNRIHFLDNIKILSASGRWLIGIGNLSGDYYASRHVLYGLLSNYMEISYIAFFVGSGIIGCVWLFCVLLLLIKGILNGIKNANEILGRWMLIVLIYMLFLSLFEGYIFSFSYVTSTIFLLLIISYINISYLNTRKENYYAER